MARARPEVQAGAPTPADVLRPDDELVAVRSGGWRMLVPLRQVERVLPAAMPAARPAAPAARPVVAIGEELVPVVFAAALAGVGEVRLAGGHQMVLLAEGGRRAALWVDTVEDVLPYAPSPSPPGSAPGELVLAWSGAERPLAVLDVARLLSFIS